MGSKGSAWRELPGAPLNARALPPFRRCVGASLESGWCCTLRVVRRPYVFSGRLLAALVASDPPPRRFRRRTAAAAPARCTL